MAANKRKKLTKEQRLFLYEKYNHRCAYCGHMINYDEMTSDHIKPLEKHGIDDISNILPSCYDCNNFKDHFTLEQFRRNILNLKMKTQYDKIQTNIVTKYNLTQSDKITFYFEKDN